MAARLHVARSVGRCAGTSDSTRPRRDTPTASAIAGGMSGRIASSRVGRAGKRMGTTLLVRGGRGVDRALVVTASGAVASGASPAGPGEAVITRVSRGSNGRGSRGGHGAKFSV